MDMLIDSIIPPTQRLDHFEETEDKVHIPYCFHVSVYLRNSKLCCSGLSDPIDHLHATLASLRGDAENRRSRDLWHRRNLGDRAVDGDITGAEYDGRSNGYGARGVSSHHGEWDCGGSSHEASSGDKDGSELHNLDDVRRDRID
jgi:hypothetical protein